MVLGPHRSLLSARILLFVSFFSPLTPPIPCQAGGWRFFWRTVRNFINRRTECSGKADLEGHLLVFSLYIFFFQGGRGWKLSVCPDFHPQHGKWARESVAWIDGQEVGRWRGWRGLGGRVGRTFTVQLASLCEAEPWAATKCEEMRSSEMRTGETRDSILLPCSCLLF